jgi:FdhE protein
VALSGVMRDQGHPGAEPLRRALRTDVDPLAVQEASIVQDADRLAALADTAGVDGALLSTLGQLAAQPFLRAWGERAAELLRELRWELGYCPVCAAWPTLAELRGLERQRWLRCGRCGSSWWCYQHRCIFCATTDQRSQGYLAAEGERDARRASTCDACHAYLKTFTTIGPLDPVDVTIRDLTSLELDMAALEQGYGRPETPGFPLALNVEAGQTKSRWLAWTR